MSPALFLVTFLRLALIAQQAGSLQTHCARIYWTRMRLCPPTFVFTIGDTRAKNACLLGMQE